jgi:hypothetical protein
VQLNLFEYIRSLKEKPASVEGELNVRDALKSAMNAAIKACPLSRHQIAGEMSHLLGAEITKTQIDSWTADSKPGNRIPAEYVPAFCRATNHIGPLTVLSEACGIVALPGPDAIRSEIQRLSDEERKARTAKKKRIALLRELERGGLSVGDRRSQPGRRIYDAD